LKQLFLSRTLAIISIVAFLAVTVHAQEPGMIVLEQAQQLFKPLPQDMATTEFPITPMLVALGRKLFFDARLSLDGTVSCASCHRAALFGTDALPKSIGVEHRLNAHNAPHSTQCRLTIQIALDR